MRARRWPQASATVGDSIGAVTYNRMRANAFRIRRAAGPDGRIGTWLVRLLVETKPFTYQGHNGSCILRPARLYQDFSITSENSP